MGRYVFENGESVWKYVFARQNSEQYRIAEELGIGEWIEVADQAMDQLSLTYEDIPHLESYFASKNYEALEEEYKRIGYQYEGVIFYFPSGNIPAQELSYEDYLEAWEEIPWGYDLKIDSHWKQFAEATDYDFLGMIQAFIEHMRANPKESYVFEGEL